MLHHLSVADRLGGSSAQRGAQVQQATGLLHEPRGEHLLHPAVDPFDQFRSWSVEHKNAAFGGRPGLTELPLELRDGSSRVFPNLQCPHHSALVAGMQSTGSDWVDASQFGM